MTPVKFAWGVGFVIALALLMSARPKDGPYIAGMVLIGTLIYQQRHKTGLWSAAPVPKVNA